MSLYQSFDQMISDLEDICGNFVIKDFVGFLNWEPALGTILLPHTGHHYPFCQFIKQAESIYSRCVTCANFHKTLCINQKTPFSAPCYLGITEYSIPIMIDDWCIGSISVGHYSVDRENADSRLLRCCKLLSQDYPAWKALFDSSVSDTAPSTEAQAVFRFIASFLAETFRPYAEYAQAQQNTNDAETGFDLVRTYIFNHYTDPTINVKSIAKACGYSESYISHAFRRHMKINLRTYINQLRIILAKRELKAGHSVSYTAMICGFNDANYFSNVFHTLVGVPPSQFARH